MNIRGDLPFSRPFPRKGRKSIAQASCQMYFCLLLGIPKILLTGPFTISK